MSERLIIGISDNPAAKALVSKGCALAEKLGILWTVVHVETPETQGSSQAALAETFEHAAQQGATIARVAASDVATGLRAQLDETSATHLMIGLSAESWWRRVRGNAVLHHVQSWEDPSLTIHLVPAAAVGHAPAAPHAARGPIRPPTPISAYAYAVVMVAVSLVLALLLRPLVGRRTLDLLFLIPVVGAAARWGIKPALLAVLLSVICFNLFLLEPLNGFAVGAPQNLVLGAVLIAAMLYTATLTARLRQRALLSDRTAQESAAVATFAQDLTRASDWQATAQVVCNGLAAFLNVRAVLFREREGELVCEGAAGGSMTLNPIDRAAMEAAWARQEPSGIGTTSSASADWQFQPLVTQLGSLAVVGLARDDGTDPVPADKLVLLKTLIAQAALAHERLRLEDVARRPD